MRILHTADWHLGKSLEQISRLTEQQQFIDFLCRKAAESKVDLVLVAGDIFDTYNPSAAAEELFYQAIDRLSEKGKRAVVVIAGNHDNPERLCAASPLAYKNGVILLGYPGSDPGEFPIGGGQIRLIGSGPGWLELALPGCPEHAVIITLPYPSESRLEEVLSLQAEEGLLQKAYSEKIGSIFARLGEKFRDDTVNLVVSHLFLCGGRESESERTLQVGGAMTVDPGVLPEKADYVALGHLHRPQSIKNINCPVYYAGSPLAYSFSEADYSKAVFIVDAFPGEMAAVTPVYLDCGKPLCRWVAEQGIEEAMEWCLAGRDDNAWVDLEIVTDRILTAEEQKKIRALHPGIINIRPRLKTELAENISPRAREGRKIDDLFRDYYHYRMGIAIDEKLMAAFIEVINSQAETVDWPNVDRGGGADATEAS